MDPFIIGLGALVVYAWRGPFSQRGQMAGLLREACVDVADDAEEVQIESEDQGREKSMLAAGTARRGGTSRSALLVMHALGAVALVAAGEDLGSELAVLISLILHMVLHIQYTRGSTPRENGGAGPVVSATGQYRHLNGRYIKDREASEPMDPCCDLMLITGIKRYALRFIVGSDVEFTDMEFSFAAFSVIRWFRIVERYRNGAAAEHRRRDLRSGRMQGTVTVSPGDRPGSPVVTLRNRFGGFRAGTLTEVFSWPSDDVMEVDTVLENESGRASFKQIFRRVA